MHSIIQNSSALRTITIWTVWSIVWFSVINITIRCLYSTRRHFGIWQSFYRPKYWYQSMREPRNFSDGGFRGIILFDYFQFLYNVDLISLNFLGKAGRGDRVRLPDPPSDPRMSRKPTECARHPRCSDWLGQGIVSSIFGTICIYVPHQIKWKKRQSEMAIIISKALLQKKRMAYPLYSVGDVMVLFVLVLLSCFVKLM